MSAPLPALLVEAFATAPLQGNGAAVVLLEASAQADWMQALAAGLQQSETAFLQRQGDGEWRLRWFTPRCEVSLCGHATLAATLALQHWGHLKPGDQLRLATRSGGLEVSLQPEGTGMASLVLPSGCLEPQQVPDYLPALLGQSPLAIGAVPWGIGWPCCRRTIPCRPCRASVQIFRVRTGRVWC